MKPGAAVFWKTVRDHRLGMVATGLVCALIGAIDLLVYPSYRDMLSEVEFPEAYQGFLGEAESFASPEGFLAGEFFSWVPLVVITLAVLAGTGALVGEESAGTLELLLAHPVKRWRLVLHKAAGIGVVVSVAVAMSWPGLVVGQVLTGFDLSAWRMGEAVANMLPVTLFFLTFSLAASALLPSRGLAAVLCIGLVIAAYLVNTIGAAVDVLATVRKVSPFYLADGSHVLIHGFNFGRAGLLLVPAGVFLGVAVAAFERRDIAPGVREWEFPVIARRRRRPDRQPP